MRGNKKLKRADFKLIGNYRGVVEQVNNEDDDGRVKIRVGGVHQEDIDVDNLPWAIPSNKLSYKGGDFEVPTDGELVYVFFDNGNPERPVYFGQSPTAPQWKERKSFLKQVLRDVKTKITDFIDTLAPDNTDVAEPGFDIFDKNNHISSVANSDGYLRIVDNTTNQVIEISEARIEISDNELSYTKERNEVTENNKKTSVGGDKDETVKGSYKIDTGDGNVKLTYGDDGNITLESGDIDIDSGKIDVESSDNIDFKGLEIKIDGTQLTLRTPDSEPWCPNILSNCLFTGAPHGGPVAGISQLKG